MIKNPLLYIDYPKIYWGYEHGDILQTCRYSHEFTIKYSEFRCTKVISLLMVSDAGQFYSKMEICPNKKKDLYSPTMIGHNLVHGSWDCICAHCISREPRAASHKENGGPANVVCLWMCMCHLFLSQEEFWFWSHCPGLSCINTITLVLLKFTKKHLPVQRDFKEFGCLCHPYRESEISTMSSTYSNIYMVTPVKHAPKPPNLSI